MGGRRLSQCPVRLCKQHLELKSSVAPTTVQVLSSHHVCPGVAALNNPPQILPTVPGSSPGCAGTGHRADSASTACFWEGTAPSHESSQLLGRGAAQA